MRDILFEPKNGVTVEQYAQNHLTSIYSTSQLNHETMVIKCDQCSNVSVHLDNTYQQALAHGHLILGYIYIIYI